MNSAAIDLSNRAVAHLQSGNIVPAFELLTKASAIVMKGVANHVHIDNSGNNNSTFRFHWEDCSRAGVCNTKSMIHAWEGSTPFIFLRALRITISPDIINVDDLCLCGFAWVVWYNLALCCSVIGTRLGEKGQKLLQTAFDLYNRVQRRIESEPSCSSSASKHWDLLQMAVTNNQACIYHDYAMREETRECLEQLAAVILASDDMEDTPERRAFCLNLQVLGSNNLAAAA